jgi:hypothetical protein
MTPFTLKRFNYDGIPLDLTGRRDEEDCWVEAIRVAGTEHDLFDTMKDSVIQRISELADAQLTREAVEAASRARVDAFEFERFMNLV